jgi:hypothetical protein
VGTDYDGRNNLLVITQMDMISHKTVLTSLSVSGLKRSENYSGFSNFLSCMQRNFPIIINHGDNFNFTFLSRARSLCYQVIQK